MASALSDLSTTALSNGTKLGQQMAENATPPSAVNNAVRGWQAYLAMWMKDNDGSVASGGTATAVTATLNQGFTAYGTGDGQIKNGERIAIKMGSAATGAATINVNALGAKAIRRDGDAAISANDWLANATVLLRYDTAYNAAAGAWVLLNADAGGSLVFLPLTGGTLTGPLTATTSLNATSSAAGVVSTLTSTDAGATAGPVLLLDRNSASPAINDILGLIRFGGRDSGGNSQAYAEISAKPDNVTDGVERGVLTLSVAVGGSSTSMLHLGGNATGAGTLDAVGLPRGQLSFPFNQNASSDANTLDDYEEGTWTPALNFGGGTTGITYAAGRGGTYVKIGKQVFVRGRIPLSSKGSSTGTANIAGLPFTASSAAATGDPGGISFGSWSGMSGVSGNLFCTIPGSGTLAIIRYAGATANSNASDATFTNSSDIWFYGSYEADG